MKLNNVISVPIYVGKAVKTWSQKRSFNKVAHGSLKIFLYLRISRAENVAVVFFSLLRYNMKS